MTPNIPGAVPRAVSKLILGLADRERIERPMSITSPSTSPLADVIGVDEAMELIAVLRRQANTTGRLPVRAVYRSSS